MRSSISPSYIQKLGLMLGSTLIHNTSEALIYQPHSFGFPGDPVFKWSVFPQPL